MTREEFLLNLGGGIVGGIASAFAYQLLATKWFVPSIVIVPRICRAQTKASKKEILRLKIRNAGCRAATHLSLRLDLIRLNEPTERRFFRRVDVFTKGVFVLGERDNQIIRTSVGATIPNGMLDEKRKPLGLRLQVLATDETFNTTKHFERVFKNNDIVNGDFCKGNNDGVSEPVNALQIDEETGNNTE